MVILNLEMERGLPSLQFPVTLLTGNYLSGLLWKAFPRTAGEFGNSGHASPLSFRLREKSA